MYAAKLYIPVDESGSKPDIFHIQNIFTALHASSADVDGKFGILFPHMNSKSKTFGHEMVIYYESLEHLDLHFKSSEVKSAISDIPLLKINVSQFIIENKDNLKYGILSKTNAGNFSTPSYIQSTFDWMDTKIKEDGFSFDDKDTYKGFLFNARKEGLSIEKISKIAKSKELYLVTSSRSTKQEHVSIFVSNKSSVKQVGTFSDLNSYGLSSSSKQMSFPIV